MKSQLIKKDFDTSILINFLCKLGKIENKYILVDNYTFRKNTFDDNSFIIDFYTQMKDYYYYNKYKYLERVPDFKTVMTVMRQLLKYKEIPYESKIRYDNSSYITQYFIYSSELGLQ